jgi:hypothetical protein
MKKRSLSVNISLSFLLQKKIISVLPFYEGVMQFGTSPGLFPNKFYNNNN